MKKISIVLLAFLFIGITNINAQTETDVTTEISEVEQFKANCPDWGTDKCPFTINEDGKLICKKSGKECSAKDLKKCCKSKSKCSKSSKKGAFNYSNSNNYSGISGVGKIKHGPTKDLPFLNGIGGIVVGASIHL